MEQIGLIELPAKRQQKKSTQKPISWTERTERQARIAGSLDQLTPIQVHAVTGKEEIALWNEFIDRYHYLGYKRPMGVHLRYFIVSKEHRLLGCLSFSFALSSLACRDRWIGWTVKARTRRLHLVLNNNRFLIFPWVEVKYLASKVLSTVSRQIAEDWQAHHGYRPVLLETFVDPARFKGTSYRAANWQAIGRTAGSARRAHQAGHLAERLLCLSFARSVSGHSQAGRKIIAFKSKLIRESLDEKQAALIRGSFHQVVAKDHRFGDRGGRRIRWKVAEAQTCDRYAVIDPVYLPAGVLEKQTRLRDDDYGVMGSMSDHECAATSSQTPCPFGYL